MNKPGEGLTERVLRYFVPFNMMPEDRTKALMKAVRVEQAKSGDFLFREGDTAPLSLYILAGIVTLSKGTGETSTVAANTGASRLPVAHRLPRQESCRAKGPVTFFRIDNHLLKESSHATPSTSSFQVEELENTDEADGDWMAQMLSSPVIQMIPPANIQSALMRAERIEVEAGTWIIRQGDPGDFYYMLHSGRCEVLRQETPDGEPVTVAMLAAGRSFGEEALLSDSPRSSSIRTLTPAVLIRLDKKHFIDLIYRPLSNLLSAEEACSKSGSGALWVDVRSLADYAAGHVDDAVSLPSQKIREQYGSLSKERDLLIYGATPGQASAAAFLLAERGFNRYRIFSLDCGYPDLPQSKEKSAAPSPPSSTPAASDPPARPAHIQARFEEALRKRLNEIQVLNRALDAMKQKVGAVESEKRTLEARYNSLRDELARTQAALDEARRSSGDSDTSDAAFNAQQWRGLEGELAVERERRGVLQVEKDQLRAALRSANDQLKQAQAESAQTNAFYEDELAELRVALQAHTG
ncbi:MAG: cyclic nucleotide-binding domain-containing protein [Pseudomonadota bacterium]